MNANPTHPVNRPDTELRLIVRPSDDCVLVEEYHGSTQISGAHVRTLGQLRHYHARSYRGRLPLPVLEHAYADLLIREQRAACRLPL